MIKKEFLVYAVLKALFEKKFTLFYITILFLSCIPIFEIIIYKQIVDIVIENFSHNSLDSTKLIYLTLLLLFLLFIAYLTYKFKILRIKFINLSSVYKQKQQSLKPVSMNWYRASLLEGSLIIVGLIQISLIAILTIYLSPSFGLIFIFFIALALISIYKKFLVEFDNQLDLIRKEFQLKRSQGSYKILSRITSSESSTFLASIIMYTVLLLDFTFLYYEYIDQSVFIAFIFVAKYLGGSFGMLSSSMMRLARSLSYTKKIFLPS